MESFATNVVDYICSGHAMLSVDTYEKDRATTEIVRACESDNRLCYLWSIAGGWVDSNGVKNKEIDSDQPPEVQLQAITSFEDRCVIILRDFNTYLHHKTYDNSDIVVGWLDELRKIIPSASQTIIFIGPGFEPPTQLLHDITMVDFDLPDKDQIEERVRFSCGFVKTEDGSEFELNEEIVPSIVDACMGMTSQQTDDRVALALRKHKDLNKKAVETIIREKAGIIRASGILSYEEPPPGGLKNVGGYSSLKNHVLLDKPCFTREAREFGIDFPRGLMLVGIPGCGKTLLSRSIASELSLPLVSMDVGNLMNKYIGESEHNVREAIKLLDKISPCVLQLDEIEKGFGGTGDSDSGASRRVFGTFIKWMSDRTSPVYVVATANQVMSLPPEFCRKGRFDEIYGLDLPSQKDREEIFSIHLAKRNRDPESFDTNALAVKTDGYTGADIEQIIKLGLKLAFFSKSELRNEHIENAISQIIPLSKTESGRIEEIKGWCEKHAKEANPKQVNQKTANLRVQLN